MADKPRQSNEALIEQLARGKSVRSAARLTGCSERTAYRRLNDSGFVQRVNNRRAKLLEEASARIAGAADEAVVCLRHLLTAESEAVRLGSARAILDQSLKLRDAVETDVRLAAVESMLVKQEENL